jgi:hypothetical protein
MNFGKINDKLAKVIINAEPPRWRVGENDSPSL